MSQQIDYSQKNKFFHVRIFTYGNDGNDDTNSLFYTSKLSTLSSLAKKIFTKSMFSSELRRWCFISLCEADIDGWGGWEVSRIPTLLPLDSWSSQNNDSLRRHINVYLPVISATVHRPEKDAFIRIDLSVTAHRINIESHSGVNPSQIRLGRP